MEQKRMAPTSITVAVGENMLQVELKRHLAPITVGSILRSVPFGGNAHRFAGGIVYVESPVSSGLERARSEFHAGDVAFMPSKGAICIFTSDGQSPVPMSPIGRVSENLPAASGIKNGDIMSVYSASL